MGQSGITDPIGRRLRTALGQAPGRLRAVRGCLVVLALGFAVAVLTQAWAMRKAVTTIGVDAAPSIIAAQEIKANLADMHSNLANELLVPPGETAKELQAARQAARDGFDMRRQRVVGKLKETGDKAFDGEGLLVAVHNVTYEAETGPARDVLFHLLRYEEAVGRTRSWYDRNDIDAALAAHRASDEIVHAELLPAAAKLDQANAQVMDREYLAASSRFWWGLAELVLSAVVLLGALVGAQFYLALRTHRRLNLPLAAATAVGAVFLVYTLGAFFFAKSQLKTAKLDAFDSIGALTRCRADAYDANGAESRWLLEHARPDRARKEEEAFTEKCKLLFEPSPGMTIDQAVLMVRPKAEANQVGRLCENCKGYLGDELNNVTFPQEGLAAWKALRAYAEYHRLDAEIRRLEGQGKHQAAVDLCVGKSNQAFEAFDQALADTLAINRREFEKAIRQADAALGPFDWAAPGMGLAMAGLTVLGFRPRLREYDVG